MYAGEGNVKIRMKTGNPSINISTWTCTMVVTSPSGGTATYPATPSTDGTEATYNVTGTEFPTPGAYTIELRALAPGATNPNKGRAVIQVL